MDVEAGETVAVSAAAGGVGTLVVQLLRMRKRERPRDRFRGNHDWLRSHGVIPCPTARDMEARLHAAAANGIDAFIDLFGPEYVSSRSTSGSPVRIETIIAR